MHRKYVWAGASPEERIPHMLSSSMNTTRPPYGALPTVIALRNSDNHSEQGGAVAELFLGRRRDLTKQSAFHRKPPDRMRSSVEEIRRRRTPDSPLDQ